MSEPIELPAERPSGCPFDPPAELARLRAERPLARMTYPDGHVGWLVTSHELNRAVLGDQRFSSRYEILHNPLGDGSPPMGPAPVGDLTGIDPPEHTRLRRLLVGQFTHRRMRLLADRVEEFARAHLDAMERRGGPADLVEAYGQPIPALMICELLGVPYEDHAMFQRNTMIVMNQDAEMAEKEAAYAGLMDYLHRLVLAKREKPADDLLSGLTESDLTDEELAGVGTLLLAAGLDTTANMISLGTYALLRHPGQIPALHADPGRAVEELMRYLTVAHTGARTALEDVELGGETIRAGETVTLALQAADRDPARYADPDTLDLTRDALGHVGFGFGIHQCLGQHLARTEMRVAIPALFDRFPTLRLAVPPEEVPMRGAMNIYGVDRLPVTWDRPAR